ncbi:MAG: phosphatidate cytidylyltransferase [Bacteroidales bacterium]|nr:phosphatidate cytidylyltransferase [Bacteroidales bacterium]
MNNFFQRLFTGIGYIAIIAGAILAGRYYFGILFLVITLLTLFEFYRLYANTPYPPPQITGMVTGSFIYIASFLFFSGLVTLAVYSIIIPVVLLLFIAEIYHNKENQFIPTALLIFGLLYIAVPYALSVYLAFPGVNNHQYTPGILLGLLSLVWINDTGAYVFGMLFGRHRLFERISPKKSWEGAIGGTVVTVGLGYWLNHFTPYLLRIDWLILSVLVSVFGVYGDLFESKLKRSVGIKDSGHLLPGHGGVLDRMDSLLFIIPASFAYLMLKTAIQ